MSNSLFGKLNNPYYSYHKDYNIIIKSWRSVAVINSFIVN